MGNSKLFKINSARSFPNRYWCKKQIFIKKIDYRRSSLFFTFFHFISSTFLYFYFLLGIVFDFFINFIAEWSCYQYLNQSYHESGNFRSILIKIAFGILWRFINIFILSKLVKNFDGNMKISNFNYYVHFINILCSNIRYYEHSFFSNQSL